MTKTEMAYFRAAKAMSELSNHPKHKLGCVVVKGHKIISSGYNSISKCHKVQAQLDMERFGVDYCPGKIHAEIDTLLPLIKRRVDLSKATIYVYRQHKNGDLAMARPCTSCQKVIRQCGITKVFYTTDAGYCCEKFSENSEKGIDKWN
jgi:deoxycytidylate deaminase